MRRGLRTRIALLVVVVAVVVVMVMVMSTTTRWWWCVTRSWKVHVWGGPLRLELMSVVVD